MDKHTNTLPPVPPPLRPVSELVPKVREELFGWADSPAKRLIAELLDSVVAEQIDHEAQLQWIRDKRKPTLMDDVRTMFGDVLKGRSHRVALTISDAAGRVVLSKDMQTADVRINELNDVTVLTIQK